MYQQSEKLLNNNISSTSPRNMVHVGLLTAEIGSGLCGTLANFNEFRVLASLLHWRRAAEVNQTLHDVWPSPGLVHYIYSFWGGALAANGILLRAKFTLRPSLALSYILAALLHGTRAVGASETLRRGIFTWQGGHPVRHWAVELSSSRCCCLFL